MRPEYEIIGDENSRWIDYSIKKKGASGDDDFDYLHGIMTFSASCFSLQEVSQGDNLPSNIELFENAFVKDYGKYQTLHNGVKEFWHNCSVVKRLTMSRK
ncbi:hypothetical protein GLOIN_2v1587390 [Rhizophagus irregularis DAOM 181602=DAOM 197198]|nr:hypothetical protein GLOIN_2v1587390 [Rhizophagus irregularis DAOM 181602=DAOM 197198]